ncbi:MAG: hypothetical protein K0S38_309 [Candidatus Paceibacter sp.]|jgi:hypothetical protein|nr:hypothetical protein [Candidatus Paceibacter sp.]
MGHKIGFFEIQEAFAQRVAAVTGIPLEEALLEYTTFYKRVGAKDWKFEGKNPVWKTFTDRIRDGENPATVALAMNKQAMSRNPSDIMRFGCMGFDCRENRVIMHFSNEVPSIYGPLSQHHMLDRIYELREMFTHIAKHHPDAELVEGFSWLYNYEAYRRLFPPEYIANMETIEEMPVRYNSTWGQFIDSSGGMHSERVATFTQKINEATSVGQLFGAFPFKVLRPKAKIQSFYSYYSIQMT